MSLIIKRSPTWQPRGIPRIDWGHPSAQGLQFLAWPVGNTFVDLVTRVVGDRTGTLTSGYRAPASGTSRRGGGYAVAGAGGTNDYVAWPVSSSRGGSIVQTGTLLALAGTIEQTDGRQYAIGGNTEVAASGDGCALGIDSYQALGRGHILRANYNANVGVSPTAWLGNPFDNRTHFFGYSFAGNGATGTWFGARSSETWAGGAGFGTTTSNRRAYVNAYSQSDSSVVYGASYVLWFGMWDREMSLAEYQALYDNPWQLVVGRRIWVPSGAASVRTATASLSTAVQAARSGAASISTAVQAAGAASADVSTAVQLASSAQASADVAVQAARSAAVDISAAVEQARTVSVAADMAVLVSPAAAAGIDAYVQAATALAASIDLAVQRAESLSTAVGMAVQAARAIGADVGLAVQITAGAAASVGIAVQAARTSAADIDAAVQAAKAAASEVDLYVQAGFAAAVAVDLAVQAASAAAASLSAAVAVAGSASVSVSAAVAAAVTLGTGVQAAVLGARAAVASCGAYVFDPTAYAYTADSRGRLGAAVTGSAAGRIGEGVVAPQPGRIGSSRQQ